jgi:hypothetical protein
MGNTIKNCFGNENYYIRIPNLWEKIKKSVIHSFSHVGKN